MKIKLIIPDSLADITLDQYQRFAKVKGDEEFISHKMLEIFCNVQLQDVLYLPLVEIDNAIESINNAFQSKTPLVNRVTLNGVKYGMIPNLHDMTFGEYTDIEENISDWDKMHNVMAVMFRPIDSEFKKLYSIKPYEGSHLTADEMKSMPLNVVFGAVNFMYRLGIDLSRATLLSMEKEIKKSAISSPQKSSSLNDGDGTDHSTLLLRAIQLGLMQFQNSITDLPIHTFNTKLKSTS